VAKLLLDTHVLLWTLIASRRLPKDALALIERSDVYVSSASILEISIKSSIGKLDVDADEVLASLETTGYSMLDITGAHAARVATLSAAHPDPFDRLLIAQADIEHMTLLTADKALAVFRRVVQLI
jgi:PIN domain nuclease of toxin-antitoxin system